MTRHLTPRRLLPFLAAALLAIHVGHDALGSDHGAVADLFSKWFNPVAFLGCGLAVLLRAARSERRAPWLLLGAGLTIYAGGNVYFNIAESNGQSLGFPSVADVMWLSLYPLVFAALATLLHRHFTNLRAAVWLDGLIGGGVVAAIVAAVVFNPVFELTVAGGAASAARLAYPVADLLTVGTVVAAWSISGRRLDPFWGLLGLGFGLLAFGDSVYVVQAARGEWAAGNLDYPYALATILIAAAAWAPHAGRGSAHSRDTGVGLPISCGLAALALTSVAVLVGLNPLATVLSLLTMLAVVMRFGTTLVRLNRQSRTLAALAATDPLTGLPNHRTVHEALARELKRARGIAAPVSVVALDIDHFKGLNDTYGHTEGDAALQAIATVLSEQVTGRRLVGRVGGEEFVLVLPETSAQAAYAVAERCRRALAALSLHGAGVSCSAGDAGRATRPGAGGARPPRRADPRVPADRRARHGSRGRLRGTDPVHPRGAGAGA